MTLQQAGTAATGYEAHHPPSPDIGYYLGIATNGIRRSVLTAGAAQLLP